MFLTNKWGVKRGKGAGGEKRMVKDLRLRVREAKRSRKQDFRPYAFFPKTTEMRRKKISSHLGEAANVLRKDLGHPGPCYT